MNRQRIFRRNGQPLRSQAGPHALIILGIDKFEVVAAFQSQAQLLNSSFDHLGTSNENRFGNILINNRLYSA